MSINKIIKEQDCKILTIFVAVKKVILPPLLGRFESQWTQFPPTVVFSLPWFAPWYQHLSLAVGPMSFQHHYRKHNCQTTLLLPPAKYNTKWRNWSQWRFESQTLTGKQTSPSLRLFFSTFHHKRQVVNANTCTRAFQRRIIKILYSTLFLPHLQHGRNNRKLVDFYHWSLTL